MIPRDNPRILLTNDDGIHAPGLKLLEEIARDLSDDIWIAAPETEQSATGHSLTLRRPLRLHQYGEKRFSIDGTPTDSVLLGFNEIMVNKQPDLVLSGINNGGNMGEDITYSGTVSAALEATLLGCPAIALSQFFTDRDTVPWDCAKAHAAQTIRTLLDTSWPKNTLMNVNFPDCAAEDVKGLEFTHQGRRKLGDNLAKGTDPRGEPYYWIGSLRTQKEFDAGTDLHAAFNQKISVTPISLDFTDHETLQKLREGA